MSLEAVGILRNTIRKNQGDSIGYHTLLWTMYLLHKRDKLQTNLMEEPWHNSHISERDKREATSKVVVLKEKNFSASILGMATEGNVMTPLWLTMAHLFFSLSPQGADCWTEPLLVPLSGPYVSFLFLVSFLSLPRWCSRATPSSVLGSCS